MANEPATCAGLLDEQRRPLLRKLRPSCEQNGCRIVVSSWPELSNARGSQKFGELLFSFVPFDGFVGTVWGDVIWRACLGPTSGTPIGFVGRFSFLWDLLSLVFLFFIWVSSFPRCFRKDLVGFLLGAAGLGLG